MKVLHADPGSLKALSWLNFLAAMMLTAFGAFVAADLSEMGWSRTDVGIALSVASIANLVAQVPGGTWVDMSRRRRRVIAGLLTVISLAAVQIAVWQARPAVFTAMALQGAASAVLTPALASLALALVAHDKLPERLGLNARYAALGTACAAGAMGVLGAFVSSRLALALAGVIGLFAYVALLRVRGSELARAAQITDHVSVASRLDLIAQVKRRNVLVNRELLIFALCLLLFQLANAGVLPLAISTVIGRHGSRGDLVVGAAVVVSQLAAAGLSSPFGRLSQNRGRRLVLLLGLGALPLKAMLFMLDGPSWHIVLYQALDAISAASFGVIVPLIIADLTHRRGHFNLAMGVVGLASGLGGAMGTTFSGALADAYGMPVAYAAIALIGLTAVIIARRLLPEYRGPAM